MPLPFPAHSRADESAGADESDPPSSHGRGRAGRSPLRRSPHPRVKTTSKRRGSQVASSRTHPRPTTLVRRPFERRRWPAPRGACPACRSRSRGTHRTTRCGAVDEPGSSVSGGWVDLPMYRMTSRTDIPRLLAPTLSDRSGIESVRSGSGCRALSHRWVRVPPLVAARLRTVARPAASLRRGFGLPPWGF